MERKYHHDKEAHCIHGRIGGGFFNPPIGPSSLSQYELNAVAPPYNPKCQRKKYFANSPNLVLKQTKLTVYRHLKEVRFGMAIVDAL